MVRNTYTVLGVLIGLMVFVLAACGGGRKPTPVPTLSGLTEEPLQPGRPTQPAPPKYLPTQPQRPPDQPPPDMPTTPTLVDTPIIELEQVEATPTSSEVLVEVVVNQAPGYIGPGEDYPLAGLASAGDQLVVEERSPDGRWLFVCCFAGRPGWIALQYIRPLTSLDDVPVAEDIRPPSPLPTPTAEP